MRRRARRRDILQVHPRAVARRVHKAQKLAKIALSERLCLRQHAAVFLKKVYRAQRSAVAALRSDLRQARKKFLLRHVAQHVLAEHARRGAHLGGDGSVLAREIRVIRTRVDDTERVSGARKVEIQLLDHGRGGVCKINEHHAAHARRGLVHQPAGLAEVDILGILSDLRDLHGGKPLIKEQCITNRPNQNLKGR